MRLEQALEEYEKKKERAERVVEKVRRKYEKRLEKRLKEILKKIDELERRKIPRNVDEKVRKIVTAERRNYVTSLRNALASIESMEDLGKRLPDLAKLHVGHGKYLILLFEKDVYAINRLLKELNEDYLSYYRELEKAELPELGIRGLLEEMEEIRKAIAEGEAERQGLVERLRELEGELEGLYRELGLDELDERISTLSSRIRSEEMELRSKASKLQKPVRRMRLGGFADEFARDSSVVLREPEKTLSLLQKVYPRLEGKYRKTARWLVENLEEKVGAIEEDRELLEELEAEREKLIEDVRTRENEIRELERLIEEKEAELKKLRNRLEHLEKGLEESIAKLEGILGTKIER
ncbi:hypothetical protein [Thermococcus sp. MV11]|uniref:hypothetical protein n=1 Tax=Thermococcus sp. MV11 TaxID=1638267 RepID=UPI001980CB79|nr:hypothetical protein [Thermococcus sp. MV11]